MGWLSAMRLGNKLGLAFGLMCVLLVITGGAGWYAKERFSSLIHYLTGPALTVADGAMETQINIEREVILVLQATIAGKLDDQMQTAMTDARAASVEAMGRVLASELIAPAVRTTLEEGASSLETSRLRLVEAVKAGNERDISARQADFNTVFEQVIATLTTVEELGDSAVEGQEPIIAALRTEISAVVATCTVLGVLISLVLSVSAVRFVARPVVEVSEFLKKLMAANGKLDARLTVHTADEVGQLATSFNEYNEYVGKLQRTLDEQAALREAWNAEVNAMVNAAADGDFSKRVDLAGKEGFFLDQGQALNRLMDTSDHGLNEVNALSRGNLTETIDGEFGGTFLMLKEDSNATVENLKGLVANIKDSADAILQAASEIAQGNLDLSQRSEQQAASLEETASSMEELASTVKQNADNAKQANEMAVAASSVAIKGGALVQDVVSTMDSINESSRRIVDIISVIDGIAFQTNILALNAAVEAARAGEQGRGFSVVAAEVRNLAQRSAAAAKEIKGLISDSVQKIDDGSALVREAGSTMTQIVSSVQRVTDIMSDISSASVEQSSGIDQVNTAVSQMEDVTQQNAARVEQASAAAKSLEDQARHLQEAVSVFRLTRSKASAAPAKRQAAATPAATRASPALASTADAVAEDWQDF